MSGTNQYLPTAYGGSANVETPTAYLADTRRTNGNVNGIADPAFCNTAWRQASVAVAALAQFCVDTTGLNANDDGSVSNFETLLESALTQYVKNTMAAGVPVRSNKTTVTVTAGAITIDFSQGNYFVVLMSGAITTINFINFPPNGVEQEITVDFVGNGTTYSVAGLSGSIFKWLGQSGPGTAPTFTFTTGYENTCVFKARDGVTTRVAAVFSGTAAA